MECDINYLIGAASTALLTLVLIYLAEEELFGATLTYSHTLWVKIERMRVGWLKGVSLR